MERIVKLAMIHACLVYVAENQEEVPDFSREHPRITSRIKELIHEIDRDKKYNSIYKSEDGDVLILQLSKYLDQIEKEVLIAVKNNGQEESV